MTNSHGPGTMSGASNSYYPREDPCHSPCPQWAEHFWEQTVSKKCELCERLQRGNCRVLTWARSSGWPLWRSEDSLGVSKGKLELQGRKSEPGRWKNICKDTERRYIQGSVLERSVGAKSWRALYTHIWDVILKQSEAITSNLRNSFPQQEEEIT